MYKGRRKRGLGKLKDKAVAPDFVKGLCQQDSASGQNHVGGVRQLSNNSNGLAKPKLFLADTISRLGVQELLEHVMTEKSEIWR